MKKILCAVLTMLLIFSLAACSEPVQVTKESLPAVKTEQTPDKDIITFSDPVFEAKVRKVIGKAEESITPAIAEGVTYLDLSNPGSPWEGNSDVPETEKIHSLNDLKYFPNLTELNIGNNAIEDIGPLSGLSKLEKLEAPMNRIKDISPLSSLQSLKWAVFWYNGITDLNPIKELENLETFSVFHNSVYDVKPLAGLKKLTCLELKENYIIDFSPILDILPNLTQKDFEAILPTDPVVFTDTVLEKRVRKAMNRPSGAITVGDALKVTELSIGNEWQEKIPKEIQITNISSLKYFANLFKLEIPNHMANDISVVNYMPHLGILDLNGNGDFLDISPTANLHELKMLNIGGYRGKDLSALSGLTQLEWLSLSHSFVNDIGPLKNLTNLNTLYMEGVAVEDFTPIAQLKNLKTLYLFIDTQKYHPDTSVLKEIYPNLTDKNFEL